MPSKKERAKIKKKAILQMPHAEVAMLQSNKSLQEQEIYGDSLINSSIEDEFGQRRPDGTTATWFFCGGFKDNPQKEPIWYIRFDGHTYKDAPFNRDAVFELLAVYGEGKVEEYLNNVLLPKLKTGNPLSPQHQIILICMLDDMPHPTSH